MTQVRLGVDVVERRGDVNRRHQRLPTRPKKKFSSTMRRFRLR
jgi:hypothetical protein